MDRHHNGNTEDLTRSRTGTGPPSRDGHHDAEVKPPKSDDEVLGVIEGVEQQLSALRNAHAEHRKAMSELADRRRQLEQRDEELESREKELGSSEIELAEMRQDFEQREQDLVQRAQGFEQRESKIAQQGESLEAREAEIESEREQVRARLAEIDEQLGALRDQRSELETREADVAEKLAQEQAAGAQLAEQIEQAKAQVVEQQQGSEALRAELEASRNQLAESNQAAEGALNEERERARALDEQVESSRGECQRLGQELALAREELSNAPTTESLDQANATIAELRGQIDQLGRIADEELAGERAKVADLDQQLASVRGEVVLVSKDRDAVKQELASRAEMGAEELAALQKRYEKSSAQLKQASEQLEQTGVKYQSIRAESVEQKKQIGIAEQTIGALESRTGELSSTIEQLHEEMESVRNSRGADVDEWNAHRRARLQKMQSALKDNADKVRRATDALRDRYDQCEQVLVKRVELAEAYQAIADARAKHARRETRSGVLLGMTGIGLLMLVLAGISWFAAGRIAPGEYAARVTLVANAGDRALEEADLESWGVYMEGLTADPQFVEFAAERMKRRGFAEMGIPGELRQVMRDSLDVVASKPGTVEIEYRGEGADRSQRVLDTLAVAMSSAANNARARRSDGATTDMREKAISTTQPLDTERIEMASMVFGGSMLGSLILGGLLWTRLSAAKARFDRDSRMEPLMDDSQWQMPAG